MSIRISALLMNAGKKEITTASGGHIASGALLITYLLQSKFFRCPQFNNAQNESTEKKKPPKQSKIKLRPQQRMRFFEPHRPRSMLLLLMLPADTDRAAPGEAKGVIKQRTFVFSTCSRRRVNG
ncbi:hypothetical protein DPMN_102079 [Dreissena polymorpha]|uniref:Uncharacterized protein n=1 Tax=Dreissena polymorpha TaxID=45954 RepID=A0A9D4LJW1_DREPO|nr:hypothetical protein DPMN_102079 [Dreissena polymorpha]